MSQSPSPLPAHGGFLLVDKPQGLTSHDVVGRVRRLAGIRRVGHAGTLDPMATGLLIVAIGPACRLLQFLVGCDKTYEGEMTLGVSSTTDDAEGALEHRATADTLPDTERLGAAMRRLVGSIEQIPPAHSAIKVGGKRLYDYARRGEEAPVAPRPVVVHSFDLLRYEPPVAGFRCAVSSGTYVRSLARDIGEALGCGAHLSSLRREAVGPFNVQEALGLDALEKNPDQIGARLLPPARGLAHLPAVEVDEEAGRRLRHGQSIPFEEGRRIRHWRGGMPILALDGDGALVAVVMQETENAPLRPEVVLA